MTVKSLLELIRNPGHVTIRLNDEIIAHSDLEYWDALSEEILAMEVDEIAILGIFAEQIGLDVTVKADEPDAE